MREHKIGLLLYLRETHASNSSSNILSEGGSDPDNNINDV